MRLSFVLVFTLVANYALALPVGDKSRKAPSAKALEDLRADYNFEGIVALSNCSGSVIRFDKSADSDKAIVLSNGHCVPAPGGFIAPDKIMYKEKVNRTFTVLDPKGNSLPNKVKASTLLYATMTWTDVSLYELDITYADLLKNYNTKALVLEREHPVVGEEINVISGYWKKGYSCDIHGFVHKLLEANYTWLDSVRYTDTCHTIPGTSGSPIVSRKTNRVIGVNNTGNEDGEECTLNNPCEVTPEGKISFKKGQNYGQETYQIYTCLNDKNQFDLTVKGCILKGGDQ